MSKSDDDKPSDDLDRRPIQPHHFWTDVIARQDRALEAAQRAGRPISDKIRQRMKYVESVLLFGNQSGVSNPTINLPSPPTLADVEAVIGKPEDTTPGSDAVWRSVRRRFDAKQGGAGRGG